MTTCQVVKNVHKECANQIGWDDSNNTCQIQIHIVQQRPSYNLNNKLNQTNANGTTTLHLQHRNDNSHDYSAIFIITLKVSKKVNGEFFFLSSKQATYSQTGKRFD
jgi:hypothetical protein